MQSCDVRECNKLIYVITAWEEITTAECVHMKSMISRMTVNKNEKGSH